MKIQLQDSLKRVINIDPKATEGAKLGTNLFLPDGSVATSATLKSYLGITNAISGANNSVPAHQHTEYVRQDTLMAVGDIFVRTTTGVSRLPLGAPGTYLASTGSALAYQPLAETGYPRQLGYAGI